MLIAKRQLPGSQIFGVASLRIGCPHWFSCCVRS